MNPWTRDVLTDLAGALHSCNVGVIPCMAGVHYPPSISGSCASVWLCILQAFHCVHMGGYETVCPE